MGLKLLSDVVVDVDAMLAKRALIDRAVDALTGIPGYVVRNYRGYVVTAQGRRHALCNVAKGEIRNAR